MTAPRALLWASAWALLLGLVVLVVVVVDALAVDGSGLEDGVTSVLGWLAVAVVVLGTGAAALVLSRRFATA